MKTIKNVALLSLAFVAITLNSCNKKDEKPSYFITATVDGKPTSFNTNAAAASLIVQGSSLTNITGQAADGSTISIILNSTPTTGKTYIFTASDQADQAVVNITNSSAEFINNPGSSNVVTVTINAVNSTSIQGTFKGDLASTPNSNPALLLKSVTNGTFNVPYSK
ncbi:MAG TPA: hypothetical protein VIM89_07775 [Mucilaginibacter sp.]